MVLAHWSSQAAVLGNMAIGCFLSASIGAERQFQSKSAGLRTHALVGLGAATFMLVSKFGFQDLLGTTSVSIDPTRVAAQIVSGIGFLGAGLIFVRRDVVRGLTTASSVWLAAAVGMAAGAGLTLIALAATVLHYVVVFLLPKLGNLLPRSKFFSSSVRIAYPDRQGALRSIIRELTGSGWQLTNFGVHGQGQADGPVSVSLEVSGKGSQAELLDRLQRLGTVLSVDIGSDQDV
jgi:putative Mg2+ transporter-C (MgtC) family protein